MGGGGVYHTAKRQYRTKTVQPILPAIEKESTALVVWGANLQSTLRERFSRKTLAMVRLTPFTRSVIIGLILSDGWLIISNSTQAKLVGLLSLSLILIIFGLYFIL
uniref:Uncharacterized protein n=1 Tax=Orbilia brochopaga TaxID=3140254 RepID=A0A4Y5MZZ6_9PEZI|nr:hypothetical protein [Drechslerella brochopaga]